MAFLRSTEPEVRRGPSEGRCFLYVLPCRDEDLVKLGHSRDPLARMEALHPRYFEFFDIDRGCLVETDTVREARQLELELGHAIKPHNAVQPLTVQPPAGGASEWYRGAYTSLLQAADELERNGHAVHRPLRPWLRTRMIERSAELFAWADAVLTTIEGDPSHLQREPYRRLRSKVLAVLDAYSALDVPLSSRLPDSLMRWYRDAYRSTHLEPLPGEDDDPTGQAA